MDAASKERLWGCQQALNSPFVRGLLVSLVVLLIIAPLSIWLLQVSGRISTERRHELWTRYRSWLLIVPLIVAPILLGAAWTILAIAVMSLACYREFARATGMFREPAVSSLVVLGILALTFAEADHWYGLFVAITPLMIVCIAAVAIFSDCPKGYIQRVALGIFAFLLFGVCFGHLAYFANDTHFRAILCWLILCVELNDVFAYIVGKALGSKKLAPNTSPNKTIAGALGALVLSTALAGGLGSIVFAGTALDSPIRLIVLGAILSVGGQLGDLTLSSIKRDLGLKDWAATFPGHGGLLDRFNSLLFVAPAAFHYIGYFQGVGLNQSPRLFTGG